jgi:hypothetical protein
MKGVFWGRCISENDIIVEISANISAKSSDCVIVDAGELLNARCYWWSSTF